MFSLGLYWLTKWIKKKSQFWDLTKESETMKFIFCQECHDVQLLIKGIRSCLCGQSYGSYLDDGKRAVIGGEAIPFGINNGSFSLALETYTFTFEGFFYNNPGGITTDDIERVETLDEVFEVMKEGENDES